MPGLNGDESVVLSLQSKYMYKDDTIQFFDHIVMLKDVMESGDTGWAVFDVYNNEGVTAKLTSPSVSLEPGMIAYFYRGKQVDRATMQAEDTERPTFYLRVVSADARDNTAIVEVGRLFGETHADIGGTNPFWNQKAFMVDGVFYNVVAIRAEDRCFKYITFRQKLPKMPIKLYGVHLKTWGIDPETGQSEILPEMPPFNEDHEILIDVQPTWTRPYSQQDKIGDKERRGPLEICYIEEDEEERFKGELKEIYNETLDKACYDDCVEECGNSTECEIMCNVKCEEEFWELEWFHTKPQQYTAFVMPADQLYLVTLAWYAPQSEITIWNCDPDGPVDNYEYERVKFWYDPGDNTDLYVNKVGPAPPEETTAGYYNKASNGGDGDDEIDLNEIVNAIIDYLCDKYPFGDYGLFDIDDLKDYIDDYLTQEGY